jgi:UDP-N-acetylmuramyl tripeptide synthase
MKNHLASLMGKIRSKRTKTASSSHFKSHDKLKIITVTGQKSLSTITAHYIYEILRENGQKAMLLAADELDRRLDVDGDIKFFLTNAKRAKAEFAIIDLTDNLVSQIADKLPVFMSVMTPLSLSDKKHKTAYTDDEMKLKLKPFESEPKFIVLSRDDENFEKFNEFIASELKINYGKDSVAEVKIKNSKTYKNGTEAYLILDKEELEVATYEVEQLTEYAMAAAATATSLIDVDPPVIQEGIANYEPVE